jgi:hypothetical protein
MLSRNKTRQRKSLHEQSLVYDLELSFAECLSNLVDSLPTPNPQLGGAYSEWEKSGRKIKVDFPITRPFTFGQKWNFRAQAVNHWQEPKRQIDCPWLSSRVAGGKSEEQSRHRRPPMKSGMWGHCTLAYMWWPMTDEALHESRQCLQANQTQEHWSVLHGPITNDRDNATVGLTLCHLRALRLNCSLHWVSLLSLFCKLGLVLHWSCSEDLTRCHVSYTGRTQQTET